MSQNFKDKLRERAQEAGFLDARVAPALVPDAAAAAYRSWLANGYAGEMAYMERLVNERAGGAEHVLPGSKSVIVLAASYWFQGADGERLMENGKNFELEAGSEGRESKVRVARYALGRDYHYVLKERLGPVVAWLESQFPGEQFRVCVDSAPLLERSYAASAGLGFIGKNGMLISWLAGSYTFLAEIVTTAEVVPDDPKFGTCGQCTRCLDECPTQAFAGPGVVDARKCISYLTIEKKSELSPVESAATGEWVFGCDVCQDVCPYNKAPEQSQILDFAPGVIVNDVEPLSTFLTPASNREFERRFAASPILRAGKKRVQKLAFSKLIANEKART